MKNYQVKKQVYQNKLDAGETEPIPAGLVRPVFFVTWMETEPNRTIKNFYKKRPAGPDW